MTSAEFRALHVQAQKPTKAPKPAPTGPAPAKAHRTPHSQPEGSQAPQLAPLRWEVAGGLHTEQHGDYFRLVVQGPRQELPALLAHLAQLRP